jgi:hypothetical protein
MADTIASHMISVTPTNSTISHIPSPKPTPTSSQAVSRTTSWASTPSRSSSLDVEQVSCFSFDEPFIAPKAEQVDEIEPVSPIRKTRGFFRTYSSNSLHYILNEVVIPTHSVDYMKILPPPTYIYLKTVTGEYVYKQVYLNKKGDRYIISDDSIKTYLQDIKGLYRYNSA